jgi:flagellar basal body rod protein FlgF
MQALAIAATGMAAQDLNVQVIANNIANINTTAFKRARAEFTDLIYQTERLQGVSSRGQNNTIPQGAQLGLGVRTAAIRNLNLQGTLTNTGWVGRQSGYDCSGERRECQRQPVGSGDGDHPEPNRAATDRPAYIGEFRE